MDEAGRGAVLGPLVVAGVAVSEEKEDLLWKYGARDSKSLSRNRRRKVLGALAKVGFRGRVVVIPPEAVDGASLTELELQAMAALIRFFRPASVILDPPVGPGAIARFVSALSQRTGFPETIFQAFPKADKKNAAVAAASILAKVVRDGYVVALRQRFGDFGWGYPGEARVQEFLCRWVAENQGLPEICRKRWRSAAKVAQRKLQDGL